MLHRFTTRFSGAALLLTGVLASGAFFSAGAEPTSPGQPTPTATPGTGDTIKPVITLTRPEDKTLVPNVNVIYGTVSDEGGSGLKNVIVYLTRQSDHKSWNGSEWVTGAVPLSASVSGHTWGRTSGNPSITDDYLTIAAIASDNAGNYGHVYASVHVKASDTTATPTPAPTHHPEPTRTPYPTPTHHPEPTRTPYPTPTAHPEPTRTPAPTPTKSGDTIPPVITLTRPEDKTLVPNVNVIYGTVSDEGGSGLKGVVVYLTRQSDHKSWNGTEWVATATALPATVSGHTWGRTSGNPVLTDDYLTIAAFATDNAGNYGHVYAVVHVKASDTTATPTPTPTHHPEPTRTPYPTPTAHPEPTRTPSPTPTAHPEPTRTPTPTPLPVTSGIGFSEPTYTVRESGGSAVITVRRTVSSTSHTVGAASVKYTTYGGGTATAGDDYTVTSGALSWGVGDTSAKTFSVPIINDKIHEPTETVILRLYDLSGAATFAPSRDRATLSILDDDPGVRDTVAPVITLTRPVDKTLVANINSIYGTVSDEGGSGLKGVVVYLTRQSDHKAWNGSEWVMGAVALPASVSGHTWGRTSGNPVLTNDYLNIAVFAIDNAGNYGHVYAVVHVEATTGSGGSA